MKELVSLNIYFIYVILGVGVLPDIFFSFYFYILFYHCLTEFLIFIFYKSINKMYAFIFSYNLLIDSNPFFSIFSLLVLFLNFFYSISIL